MGILKVIGLCYSTRHCCIDLKHMFLCLKELRGGEKHLPSNHCNIHFTYSAVSFNPVEFCYVIEFLVSQHLVFTDQIMKCTNQSIIFFSIIDVCFQEGFKIWEFATQVQVINFQNCKVGLGFSNSIYDLILFKFQQWCLNQFYGEIL